MASDIIENLHPKVSFQGKCFVEVRAGSPRAKASFYSEGVPVYSFKTAIEHQKVIQRHRDVTPGPQGFSHHFFREYCRHFRLKADGRFILVEFQYAEAPPTPADEPLLGDFYLEFWDTPFKKLKKTCWNVPFKDGIIIEDPNLWVTHQIPSMEGHPQDAQAEAALQAFEEEYLIKAPREDNNIALTREKK